MKFGLEIVTVMLMGIAPWLTPDWDGPEPLTIFEGKPDFPKRTADDVSPNGTDDDDPGASGETDPESWTLRW